MRSEKVVRRSQGMRKYLNVGLNFVIAKVKALFDRIVQHPRIVPRLGQEEGEVRRRRGN